MMKLNSLLLTSLLLSAIASPGVRSQANSAELIAKEKSGLILMREEEKLALDVYAVFSQQWGGRPFSNIVRAEQMHMDAVGNLLKTYKLTDPIKGLKPGEFTDPKLRKLYSEMIAEGKKSRVAALRIGAQIEDLDIYDLWRLSKETTKQDILGVYKMLTDGSKNHMRAFVSNLERSGDSYRAMYISQTELDQILRGRSEQATSEAPLGSSRVFRAQAEMPIERVAKFIEEEATTVGFRVTGTHDLQQSLAKEKLDVTPTLIVELCQPTVAFQALTSLPEFSTVMPCRVSLIETNGVTAITMLQPTALAKLISEAPEAQKFAEGVQRDLIRILSNAAKREVDLDQAWFDVNLPYKVALFSSNTGAPAVAQRALDRTIFQWNQIKRSSSNSKVEHTKTAAWAHLSSSVTDLLAKSRLLLEQGELAQAHESLEGVRELWAHYRKSFDGLNFTDSLYYFHEAMESAIETSKRPASSQDLRDEILEMRSLWSVVEKSSMAKLSAEAAERRQRLLAELSQTIQLLDPKSSATPDLLSKVKKQFVALYMQFG